jgi:hypothetical protein
MPTNNPFYEAAARKQNPFYEAAARKAPEVGMASGVARSAAQGASFGFADEGEAAVRALISRQPGEDYETAYMRIRDDIRGQNASFREQHPVASIGGEIAGAIALPGLATAKAAGTFISAGARALTRFGRAGLVGATEGAIYGAGSADEMADIPGEMASGAAVGGALGVAAPVAVAGARGLVNVVKGAVDPELAATIRTGQAIARDGMSGAEVARNLDMARRLGVPAIAADVAGENVRRELGIAAQRLGPAAQNATAFLTARNKDQINRLSRNLVAGTGVKGEDVAEVIETTMLTRAQASTPLYAKAMQFQAELNDDVVAAYNRAIETPLGKQALVKARRILNATDFDQQPLMARIDALKKGLDDVIQSAKQSGDKQIARAGTKLLRTDAKDGLLDVIDRVNPTYQQARSVWSDGQGYLDAIQSGRDIMKPSNTASQVKMAWKGLDDAEREAFRIGAVDAIITRMRSDAAKEPNLLKIIRSPEMRDKLAMLMTPAENQRFDTMLKFEESMFETASSALKGSQTGPRLAAMSEQDKQLRLFGMLGMVLDLVTKPLRAVFVQGIGGLTATARDTLLARQNEKIAEILMSRTGRSMAPIINAGAGVPVPTPQITGAIMPGAIAPVIQDNPP